MASMIDQLGKKPFDYPTKASRYRIFSTIDEVVEVETDKRSQI
jgi:hypothetical protein